MGHQLGSHHTHDCVWNNGNDTQIDDCGNILSEMDNQTPNDCYNSSSKILPAQGQGTIMSYCHTSGGTGINLALGFHDQVGTRLSNFANSCIGPKSACGSPTSSLVEAEELSNTSVKFTSSLPTGNFWAVAYKFTGPSGSGFVCYDGCNSVSTATSFTISGLDPNNSYEYQFSQYCSALQEWSAWSCFYSLNEFGDQLIDCTTSSGTINLANANGNIISSANVLMTSGTVSVTSTTPVTWQSKQSIEINADFSIGQQAQLNFAVGDCQEN